MSEVKYRPLYGRVLIEREVNEKVGSIILPDASQKSMADCKGKILALGETAGWTSTWRINAEGSAEDTVVRALKVGDTVVFGKNAGSWFDKAFNAVKAEDKNANLYICQDQDILAVVS